ncbi:glycoside hydrolase family 30 protein [Setomelanomma holmii]|uniref:Glycoside hydrolase family 30 protein n=1 Tax=Setomelanomma holmii TaxID=210430 RepID=A0A9P4GZL3_9PLEO|nr:glycoside hydrolase family 30 protein [Setomelanomma holmii]
MAALVALLGASTASTQYVPVPWAYTQSEPPVQVVINGAVRHQTMIGGGCSGAFGVACDQTGAQGLSPANQQLVSDYLFNENIGGLSILRNRVGSSPTDGILESCPAAPGQAFNYSSLGANDDTADSCQLKLTRQAKIANPNLFIYADAWSAPGCFKTDATDINGGLICGVRGSNCTQDWRQGYADYLVQYVKFYADKGITIDMLGAYNEPDFNPVTYASMESDGYQAADFLKVLYPTVKNYRKDLLVSCCDATGARQERDILYELESAGAGHMYDVATWHNYQSEPKEEFNTLGQPNLQTEWSDGSGTFNTTWDVTGQSAEGFQWALYIHNALTRSSTSGYLHWWCAQNSTGTTPGSDAVLVRLFNDGISVSRRLYAFAGFFRFARPGSVRIDASSSAENLYISAYENTNGTLAVVGINAAHFERTVQVKVDGCGGVNGSVKAYLADHDHNNTMVATYQVQGGGFEASMPARSMITFFLD